LVLRPASQHLLLVMIPVDISGLLVLHLFLAITLNLIWVTTVLGLQYPMTDFSSTSGNFNTCVSALLTGKNKHNCFCASLYFVANL